MEAVNSEGGDVMTSVRETLAKEAYVCFQLGKYGDCVKLLNQILDNKPNDPKTSCMVRLFVTGRDTVQLETTVTTISHEYLLEFTSEYGISEALHPELPGPEDRIVDFLDGKVGVYTKFFEFANFCLPLSQFLFDILDEMPAENTYSPEAMMILNTHRTPIQKQPEALLCLVGLSRIYYMGDEVYPTFLHDDDRDMDLFSLIRTPNPTKVKTDSHPRAAHEVPLLTVTANRATDSSRNVTTMVVAPEAGQVEGFAATGSPVVKEHHKRGHDGVDTNAPPKVLRRDHADPRPTESTRGAKSLAAIELGMGSTRPVHASQGAPVDMSDPDLLSFADPQSRPSVDITHVASRSNISGIQVKDIVKKVKDYLKTYSSAGIDKQAELTIISK
nr:transposase (putative), gypsy type [Tanacetum cinerariifolium]